MYVAHILNFIFNLILTRIFIFFFIFLIYQPQISILRTHFILWIKKIYNETHINIYNKYKKPILHKTYTNFNFLFLNL